MLSISGTADVVIGQLGTADAVIGRGGGATSDGLSGRVSFTDSEIESLLRPVPVPALDGSTQGPYASGPSSFGSAHSDPSQRR